MWSSSASVISTWRFNSVGWFFSYIASSTNWKIIVMLSLKKNKNSYWFIKNVGAINNSLALCSFSMICFSITSGWSCWFERFLQVFSTILLTFKLIMIIWWCWPSNRILLFEEDVNWLLCQNKNLHNKKIKFTALFITPSTAFKSTYM